MQMNEMSQLHRLHNNNQNLLFPLISNQKHLLLLQNNKTKTVMMMLEFQIIISIS
jgi:hypothetical protein